VLQNERFSRIHLAYEARGRVFESPRAYQLPAVEAVTLKVLDTKSSRLIL
jgi:hypothetical protein